MSADAISICYNRPSATIKFHFRIMPLVMSGLPCITSWTIPGKRNQIGLSILAKTGSNAMPIHCNTIWMTCLTWNCRNRKSRTFINSAIMPRSKYRRSHSSPILANVWVSIRSKRISFIALTRLIKLGWWISCQNVPQSITPSNFSSSVLVMPRRIRYLPGTVATIYRY